MEFTLFYQGKLQSNANKKHKHHIRREFHKQLAELWKYEELMAMKERFIESEFKDHWIIRGIRFLPLITKQNKQVAQLDIFILWPDAPGTIVSNKGDIDNRLKTLLDALRIPQSKNEIQTDDKPREGESLFFSLFEDDKLNQ